MQEPFYYRYLEGKFNDIRVYREACLFLDDYCSSKAIKDVRCRQIGRIIIKYFSKLYLENISVSYIMELYLVSKFEKEEPVLVAQFLIFLIDSNEVKDGVISRVSIFKKSLRGRNLPKFFEKIFYCDKFEEFNKKGFFKNGVGINIFFMEFLKENFSDEKIYDILSIELEKIKLTYDYSNIYSAKARCTEFMSVTREFFMNVKCEDITLKHIYDCVESAKCIKSNSIVRRVSEILILLDLNGLIKDEDVKYLLSFKDYLLSYGCTLKKFKELISGKNIRRFIYNNDDYRIKNIIQYINIECEDIFKQWVKFYNKYSRGSSTGFRRVCEQFDDSLAGFTINSINDINFETFYAQIVYFSKYKSKTYTAPIVAFYLFLSQNYNNKIFESSNIDIKILQRTKIVEELLSGYKVINYNPIEDIPNDDKWLLCYGGIKTGNSGMSTTTSKIVDFTAIKSKEYCSWIKHYIWNGNGSVYQRLNCIYNLIEFVNYIYDLKSGVQVSIFCKRNLDVIINANEALAYKTYIINRDLDESTKFRYINRAKILLEHISINNIAMFESGVFLNLRYKYNNETNPEALSNEEVRRIASYIKEKAIDSVKDEVYYAILCLLLETEFRITQILSLTIDSVQEANKKNQYIIVSETKTSNGELKEQPITIQTKRLLDNVKKITSDYRNNCIVKDLKNKLFLLPARKKGAYKIISSDDVTDYVKKCCVELELKKYNVSNLRDTHITRVDEHIIKNNLSDASKKILNGHFDSKNDKFYEDIDIKTLLEAVHGIIIGDVNIRGQILEEASSEIVTDANTVCNQCGYCGAEYCHDNSYLECLMCKDFIATISRIPFFEQQISIIDKKIQSSTIKHDKEDLINIKRLLVEFLNRLLSLKLECEKNKEDRLVE